MTDFYERLLQIQKEMDVKRMDIARATGIPESTIRGWETRQPALDSAYKVSKFLNVPLDYLISGETERDIFVNSKERELLAMFRRFDERDQETILSLAKTLNQQYLYEWVK